MTAEFNHTDLSDRFLNVKSEDDLLRTALRVAALFTSVDSLGIYQVNTARNTIFLNPRYCDTRKVAESPLQSRNLPAKRDVGWRSGIVGRTARTGIGCMVDLRTDAGKANDLVHDFGAFSQAIVIPLQSQHEVFAVLIAISKSEDIASEDITYLRLVAATASSHWFRQYENALSISSNRRLQHFFENLPQVTEAMQNFRLSYGLAEFLPALSRMARRLMVADGLLILTHNHATNGLRDGQCYFWNQGQEEAVCLTNEAMVELGRRIQNRKATEIVDDLSDFSSGPYFKFSARYGFMSALTGTVNVHSRDPSHMILFSLGRNAFNRIDATMFSMIQELIAFVSIAREMASAIAYNQRTVTLAEVLAGINHEVRNNIGYAESDLNEADLKLEIFAAQSNTNLALLTQARSSLAEATKELHKAAGRLSILKNFRWREEDLKISVADVNLNELLSQAVRGCLQNAKEKDIEIKMQLDNELPPIRSDISLIEECANNLLLNAIYFTPRGKTIIVGTHFEPEVDLPVKFWVHDQGGGIHMKDQEFIYLPFFSTKPKYGGEKDRSGSGIGLFITRINVKLLEGDIQLESTIPSWSRFTIRLPVQLKKVDR